MSNIDKSAMITKRIYENWRNAVGEFTENGSLQKFAQASSKTVALLDDSTLTEKAAVLSEKLAKAERITVTANYSDLETPQAKEILNLILLREEGLQEDSFTNLLLGQVNDMLSKFIAAKVITEKEAFDCLHSVEAAIGKERKKSKKPVKIGPRPHPAVKKPKF